jgi:hypothetical protein
MEGPWRVLFAVQEVGPEETNGRARDGDRMREINLVRDLSSPELNSMRHLYSHKVNPLVVTTRVSMCGLELL